MYYCTFYFSSYYIFSLIFIRRRRKKEKKKAIEKYVLPIRWFGSLKTSAYVFFVRPLAISFLLLLHRFFSECFSYVCVCRLSWTIEWDQSSEPAMG